MQKLKILAIFLVILIFSVTVHSAEKPLAFALKFDSNTSYLVYDIENGILQIAALDRVISYGEGWQAKRLKSYLFELKAPHWQGFFWKVNTSRKRAWRVEGVPFGELGGQHRDLACKVEVVGLPSSPKRFILRFTDGSRPVLFLQYQEKQAQILSRRGGPCTVSEMAGERAKKLSFPSAA